MIPSTAAPTFAAKLGPNHGYRIQGDIALLHAEVAVDDKLDHAQWALQLWACDMPFSGGSLSGVKIAEVELPLRDHTIEPQRLQTEARASVPGGQRDYSMVLVLASGAPGAFDQIHDFANYPARERFVAPHLEGSVGYQVDGSDVVLRAERIRNPRTADNLSGSLALELWALPDSYEGGNLFQGTLLANAEVGRVTGEHALHSFERRVHFNTPAHGRWHVVLMLREWAIGGYVTRDYCTFAEPYVVAAPEPAASANSTPKREPAVVAAHPITAPTREPAVVTAISSSKVESTPVKDERISIMHASVEEIAAIHGLTKKIAVEIVKGRPYTSLDELVRVRGIGSKLVAKLRTHIRL